MDKEPGGDQTVEEFIKGPLASAYDACLFHRDAGGKAERPIRPLRRLLLRDGGIPGRAGHHHPGSQEDAAGTQKEASAPEFGAPRRLKLSGTLAQRDDIATAPCDKILDELPPQIERLSLLVRIRCFIVDAGVSQPWQDRCG